MESEEPKPVSTRPERNYAAYAAIIGALLGALATAGAAWITSRPASQQVQLQREQIKKAEEQARKAEERAKTAEAKVEQYNRVYEEAPKKFAKRLGKVITDASEGNSSNAVADAKTIVAVRNDLRSALDSVGKRLDSEIDELEAELKKPKPDMSKVATLVQVLKQKWPAKEDEIELAVRKIVAEMGLVPSSPPPQTGGGQTR
jgi:chromosome segregation ATPase